MALPKYKYPVVIDYWKSLHIIDEEKLRQELDSFRVLFAYHSGVIENNKINYLDVKEIFENGKIINSTGEIRTLFEISNQKECYEWLIPKTIMKEQISENLIKEIHRILTKGTYDETRFNKNNERPGEYKKHDYVTGINEVGSDVENVSKDMSELLEEVNDSKRNDIESVLLTATYLHNVFERIHPFSDGNGRASRTIMNYYLMIHDLPPIIIYNEDKNYYDEALEKFGENEDLLSMVEFLKYEMEKTWEKTLDKQHHINSPIASLSSFLDK